MESIRILLVDDHRAVLEGFVARIENETGLTVAGTAVNGAEALENAKLYKPDVVLMDISMPVLNGIETTKMFRDHHPDIKVLILTMHDNREYIQQVMSSGASGYILKDVSLEEMINAIKAVHEGATYFCQNSSKALFESSANRKRSEYKKDVLSQRETTVLILVSKGLSSRKIGQELDISVRTVETHRQNIKHKLDLSTTAEMVEYSIKNNLLN
ncbi:DNA-binding response regulator [Veronia nyctiphanis]|uniref:DNA-binding response regulator n=1 Tax=Veronia nyctiphanis TaxID=1278244 RepID=A0A4Q0YK93_9GAMM|nr:response regulator transcription factor [Veronia nyctiphanis]RXJ71142.1 DNA-binding response regulator [Veronia nyctiphanis]